jgi:hypothetical protein
VTRSVGDGPMPEHSFRNGSSPEVMVRGANYLRDKKKVRKVLKKESLFILIYIFFFHHRRSYEPDLGLMRPSWKVPSPPALYELVSFDLYRSPSK